MRQYDEAVSMRLHGFDSLEAFYAEQSCVHRLHQVRVPVMFLNALDDPLAAHSCIPYDTLLRNPNTVLVTTNSGGHLGWAQGWWPFRRAPTFMDDFVVDALEGIMAETRWRRENPTLAEAQQQQEFAEANQTPWAVPTCCRLHEDLFNKLTRAGKNWAK
jgi:hypothetical protein